MRIALIIERFDPACGGSERSLFEVTRHLARRGHVVHVLCCSGWERWRDGDEPVEIERMGGRTRTAIGLLRFARWVDRRLTAGGFDVSLSVSTAFPATVVQPRSGTIRQTLARNVAMRPSLVGRAAKWLVIRLTPKQQVLLALERRTLADGRVRRIAALSDYVVRQLRDGYGFDEDRITVIPNAVDVPAVSAEDRAAWRAQVRRAFAVPDDAVAYLFAAFNPRLKGIIPLLHALGRLRREGIDAVLLMAGDIGYPEQRLAADLGVRDAVRILGPTREMVKVYAGSDVTVLPTYHDPSSRVVIESLALGTPAITTRYNGAGDLIDRGDGRLCGRVIDEPGDVAALTEAMRALADPAERNRCAAATAGLADSLTMDRHVTQLEALLMQSA